MDIAIDWGESEVAAAIVQHHRFVFILLLWLNMCPRKLFLTPIIINPILIRVYPRKRAWQDLPHSNSNLSTPYSPSHSIHGILHLQPNAFHLHMPLSRLHW